MFRPACSLTAGFFYHPLANLDDQTRFLCQRNEINRLNETAFGMLPADQRFKAVDFLLLCIEQGLII